jgi:hypothetical protein
MTSFSLTKQTRIVSQSNTLRIKLAPGGGACMLVKASRKSRPQPISPQ